MSFYALLIGVRQTKHAPDLIEAALPSIPAMSTFLYNARRARCEDILRLPEATAKEVADGLETLSARIRDHDTVLIMFTGHGYQQADADGWALRDKDKYLDRQLIQWLKGIPGSARRIVISNACYGAGIARTGRGLMLARKLTRTLKHKLTPAPERSRIGPVRRLARRVVRRLKDWLRPELDLDQLAQQFANKLVKSSPDVPMICLASASATGDVGSGPQQEFLDITLTAARRGSTYRELRKRYDARFAQDRSFHVLLSECCHEDDAVLADVPPADDHGDGTR